MTPTREVVVVLQGTSVYIPSETEQWNREEELLTTLRMAVHRGESILDIAGYSLVTSHICGWYARYCQPQTDFNFQKLVENQPTSYENMLNRKFNG